MENRIDRIEIKLDALSEKLSATNVLLAAQHESLKIHMKRSDILERAQEPLKRHVAMVEGFFKLLGIGASLAALVEAIKIVYNK